MKTELYALGVGNYTPVLIDLAISCGYSIAGLYHYKDDRTGETDHGYEILGSFDDMFKDGAKGKSFLLTMGDNKIRTELADKILKWGGTFLHWFIQKPIYRNLLTYLIHVFMFLLLLIFRQMQELIDVQ